MTEKKEEVNRPYISRGKVSTLPADVPTARALKRAGWSNTQIAIELDVTVRDAIGLINGISITDHISSFQFGEVKYKEILGHLYQGADAAMIARHYRIPADTANKWIAKAKEWRDAKYQD